MYLQNPLISGAKVQSTLRIETSRWDFLFGLFDAEIANPFCCCHERCRLCEKKVAKHNGNIIFFQFFRDFFYYSFYKNKEQTEIYRENLDLDQSDQKI